MDTIETDVQSPFGEAGTPPAEWTYWACRQQWESKGRFSVAATLRRISENAGREFTEIVPFPKGQSLERTVEARADNGRWLWDCPICNASQVCSEVDPRAFCVSCFNGGDGWWLVLWPDDRSLIETLLDRRERGNRNWFPTESVEMLQAENLAHGIDPELPERPWPGAVEALGLVRAELETLRRRELEAG